MQQEIFKSQIVERIAVVEFACLQTGKDIKTIRENELPHITQSIENVRKEITVLQILVNSRPSWLITAIITLLSSTVVALASELVRRL